MYETQSLVRIPHLLISVSLFSCFILTVSKQCNPYDENILLELKTQLGNPETMAQNWDPNTDCCTDWSSGIGCDNQGHVTNFVLGVYEVISGPIPPVIGQLSSLRLLNVWGPNISGSIPKAICSLTKLESLTIRTTGMSGLIPSCLGQLSSLTELEISYNDRITGLIPDSFAKLTNLVSLQLYSNKLSGAIPGSLHQMTRLGLLSLESNQISGSIPASLSLAPNLSEIYLGNNRLSGSIPKGLGPFRSKKPVYLDLSMNQLSGPIPESLGRANIGTINLMSNRLSGDPTVLFGRNKTLQSANLGWNRFNLNLSKVELPRGLRSLDVSHNMIYGSLPKQLGQLPLFFVDVSYNRLCGPIPTGRRLKRVDPMYFSNNRCLCGLPLPPCK